MDGDPAKGLSKVLRAGYSLKVHGKEALGVVYHAYSHFKVTVYPYRCNLVSISKSAGLKWVKLKELEGFPMGKVDRQISKLLS